MEDAEANRWTVVQAAKPIPDIQVATAADFTTSYEFRATVDELWRALNDYLAKVPAMEVTAREIAQHRITFRDAEGMTLSITITSAGEGRTTANFEEFRQQTSASTTASKLPFLTAAVRTVAFEKFQQVGGPGNASELRLGGVGKMALGAVIGVIGLGLTAASDGEVLFYGAILTGLFMFLGGAWQTVFAQKVD
jgi:hypothetical protein